MPQSILLFIVFTFLNGLAFSAFAISENNYSSEYSQKVAPFRDQNYSQEFSYSFDGVNRISFYRPNHKKHPQALIILPGRMEPAIKYFELVYDLKDLNYDIYLIDHRGQGFSDRLLPDPMKGHVEKFDHFAQDVHHFIQQQLKGYQNIDIISHSMGGAIHLRFLQLFPDFKQTNSKNILIAPMLDINFAPYKQWQAVALLRFFDLIGKDEDYIPGGKPFDPYFKFEQNNTTSSKLRWQKNHSFYLEHPELQSGDTTNRWTLESYLATNKIFKGRQKYQGISMLYLEAQNDHFVTNKRNKEFCQSNAQCHLIHFKGAKHAIHSEKDILRNKFLKALRTYLAP